MRQLHTMLRSRWRESDDGPADTAGCQPASDIAESRPTSSSFRRGARLVVSVPSTAVAGFRRGDGPRPVCPHPWPGARARLGADLEIRVRRRRRRPPWPNRRRIAAIASAHTSPRSRTTPWWVPGHRLATEVSPWQAEPGSATGSQRHNAYGAFCRARRSGGLRRGHGPRSVDPRAPSVQDVHHARLDGAERAPRPLPLSCNRRSRRRPRRRRRPPWTSRSGGRFTRNPG